MTNNNIRRARGGELHQHAEKVVALSREDFQKIPAADIKKLIRDLILEDRELESRVEQLQQAELELEESRKQATELFDFAPVGYFILDSRGVISEVNFIAGHMLNLSKDKMVNVPFINFIEPRHYDAFRSYLKEIADTGRLLSTELEMRKSDDSVFYGQLQTVPLYQKSNLIYRVSMADITERKKVEEALRTSEKRYRSFIEVTGVLGWSTNADGEVVEDIPSFKQFTGQTYAEVMGWGWTDALHPDDLERTKQLWREAVEERSKYEIEYRLRRHDGVYRDFLARGVPVLRDDGSILEWVGTCIDITERKQADEALKESEQKYRDLADQFPEIVFETDIRGTVIYANKKALASFNLSADDLNKGVNIFEHIVPEQRNTAAERFERVLKEEDIGADEYTLLRRDGTTFPSLVHTARITQEGQTRGVRGVAIDISKRKRAE